MNAIRQSEDTGQDHRQLLGTAAIGMAVAGTASLLPSQSIAAPAGANERGRAGYEKYRREFSKLIWQIASPKWHFDDAAFNRSAAAFDNPDHVAIVIHNYR